MKKKPIRRCQPNHRADIKYIGGSDALPTEPKKGRADKRTIINVDHTSNASTVDQNMHENMNQDEP